ncbi:hypothetical protein DPMN_102375 [Dreissena polymorpha]|uniref:Uncharacterized protein n=1 Tax=Dreissena polymorpha TaxID=45954 RepID=A0A9D4R9U3_DREPO|nr:hypothetical protein DPMN_102375 [Dreissena polymorpha]
MSIFRNINAQKDRRVRSLYAHFRGHKNALPPGGNDFQQTGTIFELIQTRGPERPKCRTDGRQNNIPPPLAGDNIIRTNVLTKFHEDWTINVTSTVLTKKNAPSP